MPLEWLPQLVLGAPSAKPALNLACQITTTKPRKPCRSVWGQFGSNWAVRLVKFGIGGFHSYETYRETTFDRDVTLLAGRNNVGKSSLLLALRLPTDQTPGYGPNTRVSYTWLLSAQEFLGVVDIGVTSVFNLAKDAINQAGECTLELQLGPAEPPGSYPPVPVPTGGAQININSFNVQRIQVSGTNVVVVPVRRQENNTPALWWEASDVHPVDTTQQAVSNLFNLVAGLIGSPFYFLPRRAVEPVTYQTTRTLDTNGANLTNVLATLWMNEPHTIFPHIEGFMCDVFPEINHIEVHSQEGQVPPQVEIFVSFKRHPDLRVPLRYCGTGIEQLLMISTAVLMSPSPKLFLIDEPHAFLHPYAERGLLKFLRGHPEHQYIISTHSPVFLNAYQLSHARLIALAEDGTNITAVTSKVEILDAVGITAADLWSADAILWVEGPSEVAVIQQITPQQELGSPLSIKVMPDAVRASAISARKAEQAVEFYEAVSNAVIPINIPMLFLFDSDERKEPLKKDVEAATRGRARFLPVRELENLLICAPAIHEDLGGLCATYEHPMPSLAEISEEIQAHLQETGDPALYPAGSAEPNRAKVVGSELLRRLYLGWAKYPYDKVIDGPRLAQLVMKHDPAQLDPLRQVMREIAGSEAGAAQG